MQKKKKIDKNNKIGCMHRLLNTPIFIIFLDEKLWFENNIFFIMIHHLNYLYYAQIISIHINVMNDVDTAFCITYDLSLHSPMILKF